MSRLLITHAHLLHPETGTRTDPSWIEVRQDDLLERCLMDLPGGRHQVFVDAHQKRHLTAGSGLTDDIVDVPAGIADPVVKPFALYTEIDQKPSTGTSPTVSSY